MGIQTIFRVSCKDCRKSFEEENVKGIEDTFKGYNWSYTIRPIKTAPEFWKFEDIRCPDCTIDITEDLQND